MDSYQLQVFKSWIERRVADFLAERHDKLHTTITEAIAPFTIVDTEELPRRIADAVIEEIRYQQTKKVGSNE